jgi:hypothetical protein
MRTGVRSAFTAEIDIFYLLIVAILLLLAVLSQIGVKGASSNGVYSTAGYSP